MKMVKSLLLGTAAGLVAMAGAQAADLPVKAKPVQYVKICSLYGAGFYYIPGTDMCLKIGGFVRAEYGWGMNGGFGAAPVNANVQNRTTNDSVMRARGYITADARNQSEFGTIRSYIAVGTSGSDVAGNPNFSAASGQTFDANRAFIQFAGFTFGITQSFYDFYNFAATGYIPDFYSDTGDSGWKAFAYTAQLGGGLSASISAEMRRNTQIIGVTSAGALAAAAATGAATPAIVGGASFGANNTVGGYGGFQSPDIVANLRVDQAWGSAQIMGALHEVNAAYYGGPGGVILEDSASVATKWGFAVGAGIKLNAPMIGAGDYFQTQVNYTEGALRYAYVAGPTNPYVQNGRSAAFGVLSDGVWGQGATAATNTSINLTTAWGFNAAYEHFWNKQWRTSIHGGYIAVRYNGQANALLCMMEAGQATGAGTTAVATPGCSNNWQAWAVGSRTQWNITPDTYLGLDVAYTRVETASSSFAGNQVPFPNAPATTSCNLGNASPQLACLARDQGVWSARFRVHRDFYP